MVDIIGTVRSIHNLVGEIYSIVDKVQSFKQSSKMLQRRIESLTPAIDALATSEHKEFVKGAGCGEQALGDLLKLLPHIRDFLGTFTKKSFWNKLLYEKKIGKRFDEFSELLNTHVQEIQFTSTTALTVLTYNRIEQNKEDHKEDLQYLLKQQTGQEQNTELLKEIRAKVSAKSDNPFPRERDDRVKEIEQSQLERKKEIAERPTGTVYSALYTCMKEPVALKIFPKKVNVDKKLLLKEAENLIRLDSKHVVRMWGVCTKAEPYMIVLEYMELGNLRDVLDNTKLQLPSDKRIQMALDGALGLYYIHHMPRAMLHLNLASRKFLVNKNWEVKISGVGLAKTHSSIKKQSKRSSSASSTSYICPEHLKDVNLVPNESMEVYSYGIIMWEIATGLKPYEGESFQEIKDFVVEKKGKLSFPSAVSNEGFKELIDKCRNYCPLDRPTSSEIVETLVDLRNSLDASNGVSWE